MKPYAKLTAVKKNLYLTPPPRQSKFGAAYRHYRIGCCARARKRTSCTNGILIRNNNIYAELVGYRCRGGRRNRTQYILSLLLSLLLFSVSAPVRLQKSESS